MPRLQNGGGSIGFWGCIHWTGTGVSRTYEGRVNQYTYKNVLENCLVPSIEIFGGDRELLIFQEDNAPAHKARSVAGWLYEEGIRTLVWPPRSPDLNLIENM